VYLLTIKNEFAAAHALRGYRGKCENLHGHNFKVEVVVSGEELDRVGMLVDFVDLKSALNGIVERIDHQNLNELEAFRVRNASAENIARFIFEELEKALEGRATVDGVTVFETDRCSATYRRDSRGGGRDRAEATAPARE